MARPGDTIYRVFRVVTPVAGVNVPVTGLVLSSFSLTAYYQPYGGGGWSSYTASFAVAEIGNGFYSVTFLNPSASGYRFVEILPVVSTYILNTVGWDGEVENNDLDSIYSAVAKPVVVLAGIGTVGQNMPVSLIAYRYRQLIINFKDSNGNPIDLTQYSNFLCSVRSKDQTTLVWDLLTASPTPGTILGTNLGVMTITFPDDAVFGAALPTPTPTSNDVFNAFWEVTGDIGGNAAQRIALIPSSSFTITRREVGST